MRIMRGIILILVLTVSISAQFKYIGNDKWECSTDLVKDYLERLEMEDVTDSLIAEYQRQLGIQNERAGQYEMSLKKHIHKDSLQNEVIETLTRSRNDLLIKQESAGGFKFQGFSVGGSLNNTSDLWQFKNLYNWGAEIKGKVEVQLSSDWNVNLQLALPLNAQNYKKITLEGWYKF